MRLISWSWEFWGSLRPVFKILDPPIIQLILHQKSGPKAKTELYEQFNDFSERSQLKSEKTSQGVTKLPRVGRVIQSLGSNTIDGPTILIALKNDMSQHVERYLQRFFSMRDGNKWYENLRSEISILFELINCMHA